MNLKHVRSIGLLALAAGLGVTLVVVGQSDPGSNTDAGTGAFSSQPTAPATPSVGATPSPSGQRSPEVTPTPAPHGAHREPAEFPVRTAATSYLRVFLDRKMPTGQWRARLAALSTTSHAATVAAVPRVEVPNVTLVRTTVVRLASGAATVQADLSDRSVLHVGLVLDERGWKVSRVIPYRKVVTQ